MRGKKIELDKGLTENKVVPRPDTQRPSMPSRIFDEANKLYGWTKKEKRTSAKGRE